jgi:hypothetical protein
LGAATGSFGYLLAEVAIEMLAGNRPDLLDLAGQALLALAWGPLLIFTGNLLPLIFPLAFAVYFKFGRGEGGTLRAWVIFAAITGLLVLLSMFSWGELEPAGMALSAVVWAGFVGSLGMLAFFLVAFQRRRFAEHLIGVAAENVERRREIAGEFGTATADREFATGYHQVWIPPSQPEAPHPEVPRPRRRPEP